MPVRVGASIPLVVASIALGSASAKSRVSSGLFCDLFHGAGAFHLFSLPSSKRFEISLDVLGRGLRRSLPEVACPWSTSSRDEVMVAIVSGNSLGLSLSSLTTLGQRGQLGTTGQGRSGEQSFVNIANGNLVLQDRDDVLMGRGLDVLAVRTYNSQGLLTDDNGDNWSVGAFGQKVVLTSGAVGAAGSTLTRTDRDGAQAVYTWDTTQSRYVSSAGSGAFDAIAYDSGASQFIWTDGDSGLSERYQATGQGRLVSATDADGNTVSYAYNANGTVQSVTDANGDVSYYDYSGTNLTQIRTVSGGITTTTVRYAYDASNRLSQVTVDLSPDDNAVSDNDVYVTTYTYDGASKRVASVTQSDGTKLSFTYVQAGGGFKVETVTDALGAITRFSYDAAQNTTTVTDPLGAQSVYLYDVQGQLLQVRSGVTAANATGLGQVSYLYDAQGNVTLITDGEGHKVTLQYDDHGNLTREVDSAGDTRVRIYNGANQLLTDTIYADAAVVDRAAFNKDAALPETTRYVYAAGNANRLRFVITPQGDVTEYRYDAYGQRTSAIKYAGTAYNTADLALGDVPTEAQLDTWASARDLTRTELTELVYDARGQLSSRTTYASTAADGSGVASTAATTQYIYDPRGLLLQKIEPATVAGGATAVTTYTYDGLGRVLSVSAPSLDGGTTPNTTITSYDDANGKTSVTIANGLVTVSAYDKAGRLVSVTQQSAGTGVLGTTTYAYDKDGNLLMTQDPTGVRKWMLYDEADRKIADIDAIGAVIEYVYNANGQLRETVAYATPISTASLVDGAGKPTTAWSEANTTTSLAALRPAGAAQDQKVWRFYDTANRLTWQVDALGYVTQTTYDGASRILSVTQLANPIDVSQLGNGANIELLVNPATVGGITLAVDNANPVPLGSQVTLTATIEGVNPGGMVTFFSGEMVIGSAMVVNGKAVLATNELPVGANSIRAAYSGDVNRPASVSAVATKTITGATTGAVMSFSPSASELVYSQPFSISVTLTTAQLPNLPLASGEVRFYSGDVLVARAAVVNGLATVTTTELPVGNFTLRAEYAGDAVHAPVTLTRGLTAKPNPTTTTLEVGGAGTAPVLTARVATSLGPSSLPGGTVSFYDGAVLVGTASLINGVATLARTGSSAVSSFRAEYAGDALNASSTSPTGMPSSTAISIQTSAATGTQDDTIVLTAQVAGAGATGVVTFLSGRNVLGTATVVNGQATLSVNNLAVGSHAIQAAYSGDKDNYGSVTAQTANVEIAAGTGTVPPLVVTGTQHRVFDVFGGNFPYGLTASIYTVAPSALLTEGGTISYFVGDQLLGCVDVSTLTNPWFYAQMRNLPLGTNPVTAVYSGSSINAPVTYSSPVNDPAVVPPGPVSIGITSSEPRATVGAPVTFVASVSRTYGSASTAPNPTGTVTFYNGNTIIGVATLVNGRAQLTTNALPAGAAYVTARYSGDEGNAVAESVRIMQGVQAFVGLPEPSVRLEISNEPSNFGAPVSLTATVTSANAQTLSKPEGVIDFYNGSILLGRATVVDGRATLTLNSLPLQASTLTAIYSGDEIYNAPSVSAVLSHQTNPAVTFTSVSASAATGTQDDTIVLTAQVAGAGATGVVTFLSGRNVLGTATVVNGQATLSVNNLAVGSHAIQAAYSGDKDNYGSVTAQTANVEIAAGTGTVPPLVVTGTQHRVFDVFGGNFPYGLTASIYTVAPSALLTEGGTISYFVGDQLLGCVDVSTLTNPWFYAQMRNLPLGTNPVTAVYSGSSINAPVTYSSPVNDPAVVPPATTTVSVSSSRPQGALGAPVSLTAVVAHLNAGLSTAPDPGGTVTFYNGATVIGTASIVNGAATLATTDLPLGAASITAKYEGDTSHAVSTSGALALQITSAPIASSTGLAFSPAQPVYGSPLVLTANSSGQGRPEGGTVSFYDGTTLLGIVNLVNGKASLSVSSLEVGSHSIKAVYSGDANNATSQTTANVTIAKAPSTLINLTSGSIAKDGSLSIQVNGPQPGGLVSFYDGTRLLGTVQVVNGLATLSGVSLPPGTHTFTATYAGDAHNTDSEVSFTQVVEGVPVTTILVNLDNAQDRTVTRLYNRSGQLQGTLDAEGYLTEYKYNAAGELVETIAYANRATSFTSAANRIAAIAVARASYNLTGVRPQDWGGADIHSYNLYDAQGHIVAQVDGEGYLTEAVYDTRGNVIQTIRYADKVGAISSTSTLNGIRPTTNASQNQNVIRTWDNAGQLVSRTNVEGTVTQFSYSSVGQLVQTTTAVGTMDERTSRALYDIQGRLIGELDGRGSDAVALSDPLALWAANGTTHTYDAAGRRTSTTDANGHRTLFFYDPIGRLRYTVNALGEVTESKYSALGQLDEQVVYGTRVDVSTLGATTPGGLNTAVLASQLAAVADATKDTHVLHIYNATGTEASSTDALGSTTSYSYNAFREAIASSYALKNGYVVTDTASYDRRGLATKRVSDAATLAITQRKTYDAFGRVIENFDGNNNRSQIAYDRLGRIVTTTNPLNGQQLTQYDAFNRVMYQRDTIGYWTSFGYNLANRSTTVSTSAGVSVTTVHTSQGQTQSVTDGRGNVTTYNYDKSGNLIGTNEPLGVTTGATYDKTGLKLTSTDANGVVTNFTYDAANRLLTRTLDPTGLNLSTTYAYDAKGQVVSVTDPRGIVTTTEFDLAGQTVRQVVDPTGLRLTTSYTHDTTGQVLTVADPNGNVTAYTYDGAGRRTKEQVDPSGLNLTRSYEYDAANNVTRSIDANGNATRYAYDANNRLVFTLDALGNLSKQEYDPEGRVVRRTSYAVPIDTSGLGNAPTVAQVQAKVVVSVGSDIIEGRRYDGDGRLRFSLDGTGAVVEYKYDKTNNVIETRAYANRIDLASWNPVGDRDPIVTADAARDERVRTVFDALNRATWQVDGTGGVVQYFYDANGNVTESLAYATALTNAAFGSWNGTSVPPVVADSTRDQRVRTVYDTANRATWSVDALGNVTQRTYDADGNVVAQRSYVMPLTVAALAAWDGHTAPAPVADDAHDQRVRNVYDAANRLTWSVDGIGAVSKTEYDANGNVARRSQYANPIAEGADPASVVVSSADRTSTYFYDASNRQNWRVDALGAVTRLQYDGNGNVIDQRAYANTVNPGDASSAASLASALAGKADDAHDVRIRNVYDTAGRLAWQADGTGAVTGMTYDGTGRLVRQVQYATPVSASVLPSSAVASSTDRITVFAHDGAGRRTFTVDALGSVTRAVYDAFGNVTQQIGYANAVAAPGAATTYTDAALQGTVSADAAADRIQRFAYDQANRQVFAVDAQGGTTESGYDGLGQLVQSHEYAQAINVAGLSSTASASDIRARTVLDAINDRVSRQVFDAGGWKIYGIDPMGFVTRADYDGLGQVRSTTQYALSIPSGTANTAAAIAAAVVVSPEDRSKSSQYDAAGRVLSSVDAMGFTQAWTYDALDNKTSYTNAKGAVWHYEYDLGGRMLREISPQVELTAVTPGGDGRLQVNAGASGVGNVITVLTYDSFGNLRSRTEGAGRPEQRTTTYAYDQVGRQVKVTYPPVGVYDPSSDTFTVDGLDGRHDTTQTLYTETTYDALGNAIANRDIGGNYSYKTYDLVGRVAHEVDALGYVTGYERNAFGDATKLTRYGAATGLSAGHPASLGRAQVQSTVDALLHDADRTLWTTYDRLGRGIEVREAAVYVHEGGSDTAQDTFAGKTTRNTYNTFGELTQVALQKSANTWTLSTNFYDQRGQQIASVDALGYLTTQAFDAAGNIAMRIEYAKAVSWIGTSNLAGWTGAVNAGAGAGGTPPTPVVDANNDRRVDTFYDLNNRKTSETRRNVEYSTASNGTSTRGDLTTSYGYDAVGNLTSTTDAKGATTYSYYDALGRVTAVAEPTRASTVSGAAITPLTVFRRDAYGNVVLKTEYVNGADANGAPAAPSPLPPYALAPNPEVGLIEGNPAWAKEGPVGYIASAPFEGGTALYRINNTFFGKHLYTTSLSEYQSWLAMPYVVGEGVQGYVATTPPSGGVRLYRLTSAQPGFVDVVYTTSLAEVEALTTNPVYPYVVDESQLVYLGGNATGPFDAQLTRYVGPSLSFMTGFDHLYLPDRTPVDPWSDADTLARTDRTTFAQYDALGHTVQSTDAMGVNHYSSYNSQGLIAKEWQGVTDNAGTTRTLYRAYGYDALGHQTHIYDPATATDGTDYTQGAAAANGIYSTRPGADVTPGTYGNGEGGNPVQSPDGSAPPTATYGNVNLWHLANLVNAAGGQVQIQFDFITPSYEVAGGENTGPSTVAGHPASYSRTFPIPGDVLGPDGVTVSPDNEPIGSVTAIRILQWNGTAWVTLWQGSPADATGQDTLNVGAGVSGPKVDTALEYNAFGELTAKRVNGQLGEYFDYDKAGRLWRTNAGDGVDKIALYDLQGRQTANISSAGSGRGDINLRNAADAQQVAQLSDVRRTDTTYDLIGHVLSQALPERKEVQGGVSVGTDALVGGIAARAVHGSEGWSGSNTVNLGWNALAGLGSGDVRVDLYYIPIDAQGNEGPEQVRSVILNATQGNGGTSLSWSPAVGDAYGGIGRISRVVVAKKDLQANWQTLISQNGVGYAGQSLQVASPDDPNAWVQVQYRPAGSNGAWSELPTVRFGDAARGDLSGLALGNYEYQAITHAPGQSDRITSAGTFNITPRPLATLGVAGVNGSAQTLEWQGPGAGDLQTIRVRPVGGGWSAPWGINRAAGSDWSTVNLSGLGAGQYEYEILWSHPGEAGPYAHATGQINKVDGTPGTPGTPAQGLPHIDGLYVESRQELIGIDEQTGPIYQTVSVVRVPGPPPGSISGFSVRVKGSGGGFLPLEVRLRSDFGWEVNVTGAQLPAGIYEYAYGFFPGLGAAATAHALGDLTLNADGSVSITDTTPAYVPATPGTPATPPQYGWSATDMGPYPISQDPLLGGRAIGQGFGLNGVDGYQRPLVKQTIDRWGNVLSINDPRSTVWVTNYSYNANNQMIRQVQTDADGNSGVDANGNINNANAPVTQIYYDAMGRQVAVRDANGNVNGQEWDAGGNLVRELHADGNGADTGVVSHAYNVFGDKVRTVDAEHNATSFVFDKLDRLMRTTFESVGINQTQRWDQAGRMLSQTNGNNETVSYDYDLRGNLIKTTQPLGQVTLAGYDALNRKVVEMDANGALATWKYDYFGQLQGHSDIGGANYAYNYDNARQLIAQSNSRGQNRVYGYDAAGQQTRIQDLAIGQTTSYRYDLGGRRLRETTVQGGVTYQDNSIAYDALGRMRWVADARAYITIDYDKVGNRTHIHTHAIDADVSTLPPDSDRYFQYDAMNRQTLADSATADGSYLGPDGHRLRYDYNGRRTSDKHEGIRIVQQGDGQWIAQTGGETEEVYGYDGMNRLTSTTRDGTVVDARTYDGASRVLTSAPGNLDADYIALHTQYQGVTGNDPLQLRQSRYDANGRVAYQSTLAYVSPLVNPSGQSFSGVGYTYDDAGNVLGYHTANADPLNPTFATTTNTVQRAEGYKQLTSLTQTRPATGPAAGTVTSQGLVGYNYDVNGFLTHTGDPGNQTVTQNHFFINDANGTALYAYYGNPASPIQGQRQLVVNGEVLGRYGWVPDQLYAGISFPVPGFTPYTQKASFSFGYQPINGNYPAGTPGTYAVGASDTLQSIAKGAYGDANLWYLIADANGLGGNAELRVGQVLTIPAHVSSANNSGTFKPYDPSKIMEGTNPTMMAMPQSQDGGCGAIGQIIMVVVAVVVSIYTAGAALGAMGGVAAGTTGGVVIGGVTYSAATVVAAGAIGGAVGSIASQAVGVAIGAQDSFSWKGVALGAIAGGASAGLGGIGGEGGIDFLGDGAKSLGNRVIQQAAGNAITQGIAVATGLQSSFSWRSVAASAVGAGVGQAVGPVIGDAFGKAFGDNAGSAFAARLTTGLIAGSAAAAMRGGKVAYQQVAIDAFGNALGDSIAAANGQSSRVPALGSAAQSGSIALDAPLQGYGYQSSIGRGTYAEAVLSTSGVTEANAGGAQGFGYGTGGYGFQASGDAVSAWGNEINSSILAQANAPTPAPAVADESPMWDDGTPITSRMSTQGLARSLAAAQGLTTTAALYLPGVNDPELLNVFDPQGFTLQPATKVAPAIGQATGVSGVSPIGIGLGLLVHTDDGATTNWGMGRQSFSYNPDDFSLGVTARVSSLLGSSPFPTTVIPSINNPTPYSNPTYLDYLSYKANGGALAINDFVSTGMPQPSSEPATATAGDGGIWTGGRIENIATVDGQTVIAGPITGKVLAFYQKAFDSGYAFAQAQQIAGTLNTPDNVSDQTRLGQVADKQARTALKIALAPGGALQNLSDSVLVNRYLRDPAGSGNYTIPDIRIPSEGVIIDGTIGSKSTSTSQVQKFFQYSPTTNTVVIVTPNQPQAYLRR
ncbi:Ig-like domain repeat protein [Variovorax sp. YR566]|uniref:Ig-like domain repeat protein n=1 Tax=Variovorax sp. YR566 TaxID=3450237 RepID=UPI003F81EEC6